MRRLAIAYLTTVAVLSGCLHQGSRSRRLDEVLGVTHSGGTYNLGNKTQNFLDQGADEILALGSKTIKIWFHNPQSNYPFNSNWPASFNSLVEMANHPYFQSLFTKPFKNYILVVYALGRHEHYWTMGITEDQARDEQRQFYELARYLLTNYRHTDKTFVLQHWEGDWAVRGSYDINVDPTQTAITGMIAWLNARQAGVNQARKEAGQHGVRVYHAAEVNLVEHSMTEGRPNVVNTVLPHTSLDLVSYSAWETEWKGEVFSQALDYIASNMPDSATFGNKNVYIGEYGWPENDDTQGIGAQTIKNVVETALDWGCPYIVYWEVYCNEAKCTPVRKNDDVRGNWLIKPDGTRSWAWHYLHELIQSSRRRPHRTRRF